MTSDHEQTGQCLRYLKSCDVIRDCHVFIFGKRSYLDNGPFVMCTLLVT